MAIEGIWILANLVLFINQARCEIGLASPSASLIRQHMNRSVDPCDDFYQFACGNYLVNSSHYKNWPDVTPTIQLMEKVQWQIKHGIESVTDEDPEYLQKLSSIYWSCMEEGGENKNGRAEVMRLIEKLGGWPVLDKSWNGSKFDWREVTPAFRDAGLTSKSFFDVHYGADFKNSNVTMKIDEPSLPFEPEMFSQGLENAVMKRHLNHMIDLVVLLGANRSYATVELTKSLNFQIEIAKLRQQSHTTNLSTMYSPISIDSLSTFCPHVSWLEYLTKILRPLTPLLPSDVVMVEYPENLQKYCELYESTPAETLANHAFFSAISYFANLLGPEIRRLTEIYQDEIQQSPIVHAVSKWKRCTSVVKHRMSMAVGALFIRRYFNFDTKPEALKIVEMVQDQLRKSIRVVSWMSNNTRKYAEEKLSLISSYIGYPDYFLNDTHVNEFYKNLNVSRHSYFESLLNLERFDRERDALSFGEPMNEKSSWDLDMANPAGVNGLYNYNDNSFLLLAGMLQRPFFDVKNPSYVNFGAIGAMIGHEISHAFDTEGRFIDKFGQQCDDWWDEETDMKFGNKTQCLINQSNEFGNARNIKVDAVESLAESIADTMGVKQAYLAYNVWASSRAVEPRLDGLKEFTPRQLFWLAYANTMCEKVRPGARRRRRTKRQLLAVYPPAQLRVWMPLNNIPEFAQDFECPAGSFMNHSDKCELS